MGILPAGHTSEIRIIEAALFEDMCAMFNWAWDLTPRCIRPAATKRDIKAAGAARRGTVVAAFYLIEAYLNSLAFDHVANHNDHLSEADLGKLTEWDYGKNRQRFVSFRDKLLGYPRIILGVAAPPLQENNCPEIAFLLRQAKNFRDAIVHANPKPDPNTLEVEKDLAFWKIGSCNPIFQADAGSSSSSQELETNLWMRTADNAIEVVAKIETVIHGDVSRLFWLTRRPEGGPFPESVFE
jgi:hypothetical protein